MRALGLTLNERGATGASTWQCRCRLEWNAETGSEGYLESGHNFKVEAEV